MQHLLLVLAGLACSATTSAYDFKAENEDGVTIYYNVNNNNEAIVTFGDFVTNEDARYSGSIVIPSTVLREGQAIPVVGIGVGAFGGCPGLTSVSIPSSVIYIEHSAFSNCSILTSVAMSDGVISIGLSAFSDCLALDNVVLPKTIKSLGTGVFYNCVSLKTITSMIEEPFPVDNTTFSTRTSTTLYVPAGTKALYETTAGWNRFKEIVEMADENAPTLSFSDITLSPGQKGEVTVSIHSGETKIIGYQFDMTLPEGISRTSYDDGYGGKIDRDRCPDFTGRISSSPENGVYTFLAYSQSNQPMEGGNGRVLSFMLHADENIGLGSYKANISNIKLVKEDNTKILLSDFTFNIVIEESILKGDVNGDGIVDVQDITEMAKYIVHQTSKINTAAADMDEDDVIDVADITLVVKAIMQQPAGSRGQKNAFMSDDNLSLVSMGGNQYAINLANKDLYVASQFDITLPKGSTISLEKSSRCGNHQLSFERINDTTYRVIIYSLDNEAYTGNNGTLLTMTAFGPSEGIALENTLFVNDRHNKVFFGSIPGTDGIQTVKMETEAGNSVYTIDGRKVTSSSNLPKGLYIVNGKKFLNY